MQSEDEREDCWRRLKDLQDHNLLHTTGMSNEQTYRWVYHTRNQDGTYSWPPNTTMLDSTWKNGRDVCTVCRRKSPGEEESANRRMYRCEDYIGLVFPSCTFCENAGFGGPYFHHGRCCPNNPKSRCRQRGSDSSDLQSQWYDLELSRSDEEERRADYMQHNSALQL